jgi:hypothetical protein
MHLAPDSVLNSSQGAYIVFGPAMNQAKNRNSCSYSYKNKGIIAKIAQAMEKENWAW